MTTARDSACHSGRVLARCVLMAAALWAPAQRASALEPHPTPSVLMLFSLRSTAPTVAASELAFRQVLERELGYPVDLHLEYLDLPDATVLTYTRQLTDLLRTKYTGRRVDVVVADGSQAMGFLLEARASLFPVTPIVFVGLTRPDLQQLKIPPDATGAVMVLEGQRTIDIALSLHPDAERVVIVGGSSPMDQALVAFAGQLIRTRKPGIETLSLAGQPLDGQLRRLAELPPRSVVIFTTYRADSSDRSMVSRDVLRLVSRAANAPTYGGSEAYLGYGIVGGDLVQSSVLAGRAATLAARILKGESPASLPPVATPASALMFDWRELQRWGIDEARLPAGSAVLFREPPAWWVEHRSQIAGMVVLVLGQGALIGALLIERRTRRRAQVKLAEAEGRYRTIADFTGDWEYWTRPDGSFVYVSPSCEPISGYPADAFLSTPALLTDIIVEEDRARWEAHREEAKTTPGTARIEFRVRTAAGESRWIDHVCSRVTSEDGQDLGVRGSNRDVTARKQSEERLQYALEENQRLRDRLEVDNTYLREQLQPHEGLAGIVGTSDMMGYVFSKVQQVAPTPSTVLLQGETGVGKSLIAQAIHEMSPRSTRPLVTLNCAALAPTLIESELFGHEKGSFTGALALRRGRFEIANGSTLFLDEIAELSMELQGKLLRAIQDGEFERVGGSATIKTDVRLIAATNKKLDEEVRGGRFRQDLWYRLNVFPITVPPLRQRQQDIPVLAGVFVEKYSRRMGKPVPQVSKAAMKALQARDWPGNVRELENVIERAVISCQGPLIEFDVDSPPVGVSPPVDTDAALRGQRTLARVERDYIVSTLENRHWRVEGDEGAAVALGVNPSTLRSRMQKHGIQRPPTSQRT